MRHWAAVIAALVLLLLAVGCGPAAQHKRVQLTSVGQTRSAGALQWSRAPLRIAVAGVISPKQTFKTYQDLLQYLGGRLERPVELVQRNTYAEVNDLVRTGGVDLAFVCSLAYVQGQQDFGMELLAAPEVRGEAVYYSYVIVPAASPAARLEDLRGKLYAFTDPDSNSGRLVPTYQLWLLGETPESYFRKVVYTYSHDNSIKAVADRLVDGASVDSLVYDYAVAHDPELAGRTRVIWRSEPFGAPPVVVHPSLGAEIKARLQTTLLEMHTDPQGRAILDRLEIDRFVPVEPAAYEPIRQMLRQVRGQP